MLAGQAVTRDDSRAALIVNACARSHRSTQADSTSDGQALALTALVGLNADLASLRLPKAILIDAEKIGVKAPPGRLAVLLERSSGTVSKSYQCVSKDRRPLNQNHVGGNAESGAELWFLPARSPLWERSHKDDHGNSRLMSSRAEMRNVAGSVRASRAP